MVVETTDCFVVGLGMERVLSFARHFTRSVFFRTTDREPGKLLTGSVAKRPEQVKTLDGRLRTGQFY